MLRLTRRKFLRYGGLGIGYGVLSRNAEAATFFLKRYMSLPPKETLFYTPNQDFYIVNYSRPQKLSLDGWSLPIRGRVQRSITLSYNDILALPSTEMVVTLMCIDNEVAGNLIGNALWKGVLLKTVLSMVKPLSSAQDLVMHAADDYSESITLNRAMNYDVLLAYEMNGERLPTVHGFPLRAVVPGLYGIKNVKWLTGIELVDYDYKGYWQQRSWTDRGEIKVTSRIDAPGPYNTIMADLYTMKGIAFAGARGIGKVEVTTNGGKKWYEAERESVPSNYCWVPWKYNWKFPEAGSYELQVRAIDKIGRMQTLFITRAFPEGTSGLHSVISFVE